MAEKNKNPEIRFKGFTDEWELHELGDLLGIRSASRVHKNEWTKSGVPFFRSSDVVADYKGMGNNKAFISFELYEKLSNKSGCVQKNDLLVTGGGSIGIPYLVKSNEPLYFKDADLLWLKNANNINSYFLYTFFSTMTFRHYVNSITHIGTISHYTIEQAKSTPIKVPRKEEQNKIGGYLANIDKLINLHQRKYDKLINIKKSMLKKMFPKNGENVPEIRFKGFNDVWKVRKLNEISTYNASSLSIGDAIIDGKYELYDANQVIGFTNENVQASDYITIIKDGSGVGRVRLLQKNTSFIGTMGAIHCNGINIHFLYCCLIKTDFSKHITGATIPHIYYSNYGNDDYYIPNNEEQTQIGVFFKQLDNLINLQQCELDKLKNVKKSMLEKMFV